jgi:Ca2+-binding EF-hand superfamily protein
MFKLADLDNSGSLDMREFRLYFKKLGLTFSDHRVKEIFSSAKIGTGG